MNNKSYILAIDQGTTSSRALLLNKQGEVVHTAQQEINQIFPQPGWVEQDAEEIWQTTLEVMKEVMHEKGMHAEQLPVLGLPISVKPR